MPVEIRELIIKTEVISEASETGAGVSKEELGRIKWQLMKECRRLAAESSGKNKYDR